MPAKSDALVIGCDDHIFLGTALQEKVGRSAKFWLALEQRAARAARAGQVL